jgi:hypothetical protein
MQYWGEMFQAKQEISWNLYASYLHSNVYSQPSVEDQSFPQYLAEFSLEGTKSLLIAVEEPLWNSYCEQCKTFDEQHPCTQIMAGIYLGNLHVDLMISEQAEDGSEDHHFDVVIKLGPYPKDIKEFFGPLTTEASALEQNAPGKYVFTLSEGPIQVLEIDQKICCGPSKNARTNFQQFLEAIEQAKEDTTLHAGGLFGLLDAAAKGEKRVLVASPQGSLGASLLMFYLLSHDSMDAEAAFRIIWNGRPSADPAFFPWVVSHYENQAVGASSSS